MSWCLFVDAIGKIPAMFRVVTVGPLIEEDGEEIAYLLERSDVMAVKGGNSRGSLSLGDAACLAVARRMDVVAVVSDGTWEILEVPGLKVRPFR